jgi:hypothetical protein
MKTFLLVATALLLLANPAHAVDASTKKYCVQYDKQVITVTGNVLIRKIEYDNPNDAPPEGRGGSVRFPMLILDQPICAWGENDAEDGPEWALHFLDDGDCFLKRWTGNRVKVTGTIFHGVNWHHHTTVLFHAKRVEGLDGKLPTCEITKEP